MRKSYGTKIKLQKACTATNQITGEILTATSQNEMAKKLGSVPSAVSGSITSNRWIGEWLVTRG